MRIVAPFVIAISLWSCHGPRADAIQVTVAYHQDQVLHCCVTGAVIDVWKTFSPRHPEIRVAETTLNDAAYKELINGNVRHDLNGNVVILVFDSDDDLMASGVELIPGVQQLCESSRAHCAGGVPEWVPSEHRKIAELVMAALADALNKRGCSLGSSHC